jgi:hypothetical protein
MTGKYDGAIVVLYYEPVDGLATFLKGITGLNYEYKEMKFNCPGINENIIPSLVQYALWGGSPPWPIFDLAKEYLRKKSDTFVVVQVCLGYPTPPHTLMSEVVIDLKDYLSGEWPKSLLDSLPIEGIIKDYELVT